jgi:peptidoglycan/LPS O-acetylase OafA/YrhL
MIGLRFRTWLLLCLLGLTLAFNVFRHWVLHDFSPENLHSLGFADQFLTSPFLLEFFAGALLAAKLKTSDSSLGWLALAVGVAGFFLAGWANIEIFEGKMEQGFYFVPRVFLFGIPALFIVTGLVLVERCGHVAPRRFSIATGGASYALYLCHTMFFAATMKMGLNAALKDWAAWQVHALFAIYVALIVAFSVAHYQIVERSLHNRFKQILAVRKTVEPQPA